jgi:hypothetical protein
MENEKLKTENSQPVDYEEKIRQQTGIVKKLEDSYKRNPSDDSKLELARETDLLRHYTNAAVGNPGERAKLAAEIVGTVTLNRAVQQIPSEE